MSERLCLYRICKITVAALLLAGALEMLTTGSAYARDVNFVGADVDVYVNPGEPTQVTFPGKVDGGFKRRNSSVFLEKQDNYLVVFANPSLGSEGERIIVQLNDRRTYPIRVLPAVAPDRMQDNNVQIMDARMPERTEETTVEDVTTEAPAFAPPTVVPGLMRELILVAEFAKRTIRGYRRDNKYSGETILNDGAISAKIDEIFMGPELWAYVISVENLLQTTQRLNPATFRIDGTKAISAKSWELAPRPLTAEQQLANAHMTKLYIITRAKNR